MDNLDAALTGGREAQLSVIGSMLIDDRCIPLVLSRMTPDDFVDSTCRATFQAIRRLTLEGRPADPVTVVDAMQGGDKYTGWVREVMLLTPTAANVEAYIGITRRAAVLYRLRELADKLTQCLELDQAELLVRKMSAALSATDRMPRMTGQELASDFWNRVNQKDKPRYLPWGLPTADRAAFAELGDMILLGGYASSGKTLLSLLMAMAQAKAGYRVGYYSLETKPEKLADRIFAGLAKVPLGRIKTRDFGEPEWGRLADAARQISSVCPFDVIRAAGSTVDDIAADAVARGYQVIYVDYVQLVQVPGVKPSDRYAQVTAASQGLKTFAQSTNTAVVALAQLSRPEKSRDKAGKPIPPSMHSFRESGQLEQDADVAFLVYPSNPEDNTSNRVFKVGKNKEGPRPRVELVFHGDTQTMAELETDHSVAAQMSNIGRAVKQANRMAGQVQFQECRARAGDNPFEDP